MFIVHGASLAPLTRVPRSFGIALVCVSPSVALDFLVPTRQRTIGLLAWPPMAFCKAKPRSGGALAQVSRSRFVTPIEQKKKKNPSLLAFAKHTPERGFGSSILVVLQKRLSLSTAKIYRIEWRNGWLN
jgi:hypothetical protein